MSKYVNSYANYEYNITLGVLYQYQYSYILLVYVCGHYST